MPDAVADRLVALVGAMREHGLSVGTAETVTAAEAINVLGMHDRALLRDGLAATLVRSGEGRPVFDQLFDLYFPTAPLARSAAASAAADVEQLRAQLTDALARNDDAALDALAAAAVELLGRVPGEAQDRGWSSAQTLDRLAPQRTIAAAEQQVLAGTPAPSSASEGAGSGDGQRQGQGGHSFTDRLVRDELRAGVDRFRQRVTAEALRRNTAVRQRDRIARYGVRATADRRDFLQMGTGDLAALRREIDPLARKLATRLEQRRRSGRGELDIRRTLRASMATGGVPIDPAYKHRRRHRPDLVVLADLSGSVGGFSSFTMLLMQALQGEFRHLRLFGFVSSTADITDAVRTAPTGVSLTSWALRSAPLTTLGSSSSYGGALTSFERDFPGAVGPRSTLLVLGDARTNHGDPALGILSDLVHRARHAAWLNPEAERSWGAGDSVAHLYRRIIRMHECRNAAQLRRFVAATLPI
ncbi:VWA domain-containing protein [Calidifontibacter sp. DB0510]|uniref:VWA domain-containing protein n=1 Tax=Metallococcus carri TaxID=1656884 RepID=A0A967B1Z6_9MICO|nr:VWA domain-containing protein [Metallococcus carri]NHN56514.1 VWA domain-containing protein [Metallococcus carri]NOP38813.1 VWA domain-containing protein [Calidifontibacter sp. DB2511S]